MLMRRYTDEGLATVHQFLTDVEAGAADLPDAGLLQNDEVAPLIPGAPELRDRSFGSRWAFAQWACETMVHESLASFQRDPGLWAWLSMALFEVVCPRDAKGERRPGARARHVPEFSEWSRYYRHLLVGPWIIYRAHEDQPHVARALLCQPLHAPGDVVEQLASRMQIVANPALMELATHLYFDPSRGQLKRGAGGKTAGSARRLARVIGQFDLTYDLYSMPVDQLTALMPREFERWMGR